MLGILEELKNPILQNNFKEAKELFEKNDKKEIPAHLNRVAIVLNKNEFDDLDKLNYCNIITAPKEIKLSEILNKMREQSNEEIYFNRAREAIGYGEPDEDWRQNTWQTLVIFRDMKIIRVCMPMVEITKWLYILWIAGTTIIDDLEVKENE